MKRWFGKRMARLTRDDRWEQFPGSILGHILQGGVCGALIATGEVGPIAVGTVWMAASSFYQWAGFAKYGDTVKRDWKDYLVGFIPAGLVTLAAVHFF